MMLFNLVFFKKYPRNTVLYYERCITHTWMRSMESMFLLRGEKIIPVGALLWKLLWSWQQPTVILPSQDYFPTCNDDFHLSSLSLRCLSAACYLFSERHWWVIIDLSSTEHFIMHHHKTKSAFMSIWWCNNYIRKEIYFN